MSIHVGDVGTALVLTIVDETGAIVDVSTASTKQIIILRPDGTPAQTYSAVFDTTGTDGKIKYVTATAADLPVAGSYGIQGYVVIGGNSWHTDVAQFPVMPNLGS